MKQHKTLCYISMFCYQLFTVAALILIVILSFQANNAGDENDIGTAIGIAIGAILQIFAAVYLALLTLPALSKLLHIRFKRIIFAILCFPFDAAFLSVHIALLVGACQSDPISPIAIVLYLALVILSVIGIVCNILSIRTGRLCRLAQYTCTAQ